MFYPALNQKHQPCPFHHCNNRVHFLKRSYVDPLKFRIAWLSRRRCFRSPRNFLKLPSIVAWKLHRVDAALVGIWTSNSCTPEWSRNHIDGIGNERSNSSLSFLFQVNGARFPAPSNGHPGTECAECSVKRIQGKCYKCDVCANYTLCQKCFNTPVHQQHAFSFREVRITVSCASGLVLSLSYKMKSCMS